MKFNRSILLLLSLIFALSTFAVKIEFHSFKDKQQEALYLQLIAELRCVRCQNQNLAESNAELASDMREKTYKMVVEGGSREDVVNYMTARYGDFVLYKPPLKKKTILLWVGPPLFLLLSLFLLFRIIRKQQSKSTETMSDTDRESMRELLSSNSTPNSKKEK